MPKKKTARRRSPASSGVKLLATIKKQGALKGAGVFAAKQTGIKAMKTVVPAYLSLMLLAAATPRLANSLSAAAQGVPIVGPVADSAIFYGRQIRRKTGR
mgnify:CR=1 FL=1